MLEVLKIIVLACQVTGGQYDAMYMIEDQQKKCQKELIQCVNKSNDYTKDIRLSDCLLERK